MTTVRLPSCSTGTHRRPASPSTDWRSRLGLGVEPAVVRDLGDERAHLRVHAVRGLEEQAEVVGHGVVRRRAGARARTPRRRRDGSLRRLRELLRIAEQHDVLRRAAHRDDVGERLLARFVDEQHVDRVAHLRRAPRATRCRRPRRPLPSAARFEHVALSFGALDARRRRSAGGRRPSGSRAPLTPRSSRDLADLVEQVADRRRAMCAVIPTRFPAARGRRSCARPWYVLPEPGGPWIARYEPLSSASRRRVGRGAATGRGSRGTGRARRCRGRRPIRRRSAIAFAQTLVSIGPARDQRAAGGSPADVLGAALEVERARGRRRSRTISPAFLPVAGSTGCRADRELVVLRLELVPVHGRLSYLVAHLLLELEAADALAVVDEVVVALVARSGGSTPTTRASPRGGASRAARRAASRRAARASRARQPAPAQRCRAPPRCGELARTRSPSARATGRGIGPNCASASARRASSQSRSSRGGAAVVACCRPRSRRAFAWSCVVEPALVGDDARRRRP